jgi:signal recognition particle GTPase
MGLLSPKPKVFKTKEEIRKALLKIKSLDYKERPEVFEALAKELDYGGVNREEVEEVIRQLRKEYKISEVDAKNLRQLLNDSD